MIDWYRLLSPKFWLQNYPTNMIWDAALNAALDEFKVTKITQHTVQVGPFTVWVSNWPYAYGKQYAPCEINVLPTVATRKRLSNAILQASIDQAFNSRAKGGRDND